MENKSKGVIQFEIHKLLSVKNYTKAELIQIYEYIKNLKKDGK